MTSYPGRMVIADLTEGTVRCEKIPADMIAEYLGGRGIGSRLLWDLVPEGADPLGPENALLFVPGTLTGTSAPSSGRTTVLAKGPATGQFLKANVGGHLGIELKMAHVDLLAIVGAATRPMILVLGAGAPRLEPAEDLWGTTVRDVTRKLKQAYGANAEVACIGPAGEHLVQFAAIMTSTYNAAARGGIGAVMGAKKLKAIIVKPSGGRVDVAEPAAFSRAVEAARDALYGDSVALDLHKYGTARDVDVLNELKLLPSYNFQRSTMPGDVYALSGRSWGERGYLKRIVGCGSCIYCCHRFTRIDSGHYAGVFSGGPEYETVAAFGTGCGVSDVEPVFAANALCNDLGLDTISTGNVIQWTMESAERGVLTERSLQGLDLAFGNGAAVVELVRLIGYREGIGDLLAEGVAHAAAVTGKGSEAWAVEARGLEQSNVELRGAYSYALAFAVNPRGPDHLHSECLAEFGGTREGIRLVKRITGDERLAVPNREEGRGTIVRWHEDMYAVTDAVGLCAFATTAAYSLTEDLIADLVSSATGVRRSGRDMMEIGRRIATLERCFGLREGLIPEHDDRLPRRMMEEQPVDLDGETPMDAAKLRRLLHDYYTLHEWNPDTGRPTRSLLRRLGLGYASSVSDDCTR